MALPEMYGRTFMEMQKGGVKGCTDLRNMKNFAEFWKTLRKLGISDKEVWTFPTKEWLLEYI